LDAIELSLLPTITRAPRLLRDRAGKVRPSCFMAHALLQIPNVGVRVAVAVSARYRTLWSLMSAYRKLPPDARDALLAPLFWTSSTATTTTGTGTGTATASTSSSTSTTAATEQTTHRMRVGDVLSTRIHRMLFLGAMDAAWAKQRGSTCVDVAPGGTPAHNITHRNLLTQILRCVHGVGLAAAMAITARFENVRGLVLHFFHCASAPASAATPEARQLGAVSFTAQTAQQQAKARAAGVRAAARRLGPVLAQRIERCFCAVAEDVEDAEDTEDEPTSEVLAGGNDAEQKAAEQEAFRARAIDDDR
jgi:hypothetical protein